ncbi:MAG: hypothetical protein ABI947_17035 [Chloroflexota bacterium]
MGKIEEILANEAASKAFKNALKHALDAHHPEWVFGNKGQVRGKNTRRLKFASLSRDTLLDWTSEGKAVRPQREVFEAFLEEGDFPEETTNILKALYREFKREPKERTQRNQTQQLRLQQGSTQHPSDSTQGMSQKANDGRAFVDWKMIRQVGSSHRVIGGLAMLLAVFLFGATIFLVKNMSVQVSHLPTGITRYGNGYCGAVPLAFTSQTNTTPPHYYMYLSPEVPYLDWDTRKYFIYFRGNYVEKDITQFQGKNEDRQQWQVRLGSTWVTPPNGWNLPENWLVQYQC